MNAAHHSGFGQVVNYRFDWLPEDPDGQVRESIRAMGRMIREDSQSPLIQERAARALEIGQGDPIVGVWRTIKPLIRFMQDREIAAQLQTDDPRIADVVEVFIRPVDQELLIRSTGQGFEDCDGFELYGGALLTALGVPIKLVTVGANPVEPNRYSHVYIAAYPNGKRIPLDFSHGPYAGWECKNLGRMREWSINGSLEAEWIALLVAAVAGVYLLKRKRNA